MSEVRDLLGLTAEIASDFYETLDERPVAPPASTAELREALGRFRPGRRRRARSSPTSPPPPTAV